MLSRFVDRDMMMRYYWGHGIGHTYAHHTRDPLPGSESEPGQHVPVSDNMDVDIGTFAAGCWLKS
jgi:hypothetical protein